MNEGTNGTIDCQVEQAKEFVNSIIEWCTGKGLDFALNAATALLIFLLGALAIKLLDRAVRKALEKTGRKILIVNFIASVVTKSCWAVLAVTVLARLGVDVGPLVAGLGVTGFILGFAFQESLGNLASGLMIALNEPFKVGDFVEAAGLSGSILEINMMATVMATPDNKRIVLPNKAVWGGPITNYSALDKRRVDMQVGIAYGEDVAKAIETIRGVLAGVEGVLEEPAPAVATAALDASQVTINIRPWAKTSDYWAVYSATLSAVKDALQKAGIEIPFPQITVHTAKA
ncbi:MAG: mechanosensitive ion channel family protein [Kiritimatiellae bacterium]|nr:mechanosensitive ion channel family protein [Kiritimatiellia bacterium]